MKEYLGLLRELASLDPPAFVFGGVAEEALLDGALTPSHGDLDLLIPRNQLGLQVQRLGEPRLSGFRRLLRATSRPSSRARELARRPGA